MIYIAHFKYEYREKDADFSDKKTIHDFNVGYFASFNEALAYVRKFHEEKPILGFDNYKWIRESISITETKNDESRAEAYKAMSWESGDWGCMTLKVYAVRECTTPADDIEHHIYD